MNRVLLVCMAYFYEILIYYITITCKRQHNQSLVVWLWQVHVVGVPVECLQVKKDPEGS